MSNNREMTRMKRITNKLADSVENSVTEVGQNFVSVFIHDLETWLMSAYEEWKRSKDSKSKLGELQRGLELNSEAIQIGMDKKEISVMWAMRKLGYTEEQTQAVLDLANQAYLPKGE